MAKDKTEKTKIEAVGPLEFARTAHALLGEVSDNLMGIDLRRLPLEERDSIKGARVSVTNARAQLAKHA